MYQCVAHNDSVPLGNVLESIFKFSHLLIRGFIKGSSPNQAIFSTFAIELHYYIVHSDSKLHF